MSKHHPSRRRSFSFSLLPLRLVLTHVPSRVQAELLDFYDFYFSVEGAGRRKLSAWAHGNQYPVKTTAAAAAAAAEAVIGQENGGGGGGGGASKDATKDEGAAATHGGSGCGSDERRGSEVVMVEDYAEFKRSMPLLPLRKPAPVQLVDLNHSVSSASPTK